MRTRQHWPVNWVDGMKINKTHFLMQDENLREQLEIVTSLSLNEYNYGLIEADGNLDTLGIVITSERVELNECRAVTLGGHYLEVNALNNGDLHRPMSDLMHNQQFNESEIWTIVLRVETLKRDLLGEPNPEESPLRHPYAASRLSLEVIPAKNLAGSEAYRDAIPLAQIEKTYKGIERRKDYYPPLTRVRASLELVQTHGRWQQQIVETESYLFEIVRKVNDKHIHGTNNGLSQDLLNLTSAIMRYINDNYDRYTLLIPSEPPVQLVLWFMGMARVIVSELRLASNPENMEKYIAFYINDSERYQILQLSNNLKDHQYDHANIADSVQLVGRFISAVNYLFGQLRSLHYNEIADPTIINRMSSGSIITNPAAPMSGNRRTTSMPPPPTRMDNVPHTPGKRKINIRRSNRGMAEPPPSDTGGNPGWDLDD